MSGTYERIWLQCPNTDPENKWCGETTWCKDKINDDDVEYVRGDIVESLRQWVKELENTEYVADGICHEQDGCPTENAVLKREWRALRQRVKELDALRICADQDANELAKELAAKKQGQSEPVARIVDIESAANVWWYKTPKELGVGTLLYTAAPKPEGS